MYLMSKPVVLGENVLKWQEEETLTGTKLEKKYILIWVPPDRVSRNCVL